MHVEVTRTLQAAMEATYLADQAVSAAVEAAEETGEVELSSALAYLRRPLRTVKEALQGFYEHEDGPHAAK